MLGPHTHSMLAPLLRVLFTNGSGLTVGLLNATTGALTPASELVLPAPSKPSCRWDIGATTAGRTSTSFFGNGTFFLLAQEACPGSPVDRTALLGFYGPHTTVPHSEASPSPVEARAYATFDPSPAGHLADWNIMWDYVCNVIAVAPHRVSNSSGAFASSQVLMVSEYDGQIRPQTPVPATADGSVKVSGLGALESRGQSSGGPLEWNCGDDCVLYWLEERPSLAAVGAPLLSYGSRALECERRLRAADDDVHGAGGPGRVTARNLRRHRPVQHAALAGPRVPRIPGGALARGTRGGRR